MPRTRRPEDRQPDDGYLLVPTGIYDAPTYRRLTIEAQVLYLHGMLEMVRLGSTDLVPYEWTVTRVPQRHTRDAAVQLLLDGGYWLDVALGFQVLDWSGIQVHLGLTRAHISNSTRQTVYARDGHRCVVCGTADRLSLDHIIPWSASGSDKPDNLRTLCVPCNSRKGARRLPSPQEV